MQEDHGSGHLNYLHSNYDTYVFYPTFTETNVLTMVRNAFIEALNRRIKLPSTVVILLSDQIIVEDPLYLPSEIDRKLKWILRELDAAVKIRKSLLPTKAYIFGQPRFMWVRGFNNTRANYISDEILIKFNNMLRKTCMAKAVYTIPTYSYNESAARCFDFDGKTQIKDGFNLLWHDIIHGIKSHDLSDERAEIDRVLKENQVPQQNHGQRSYHSDRKRNSSGDRKRDSYHRTKENRRDDCRHERRDSSHSRHRESSNHRQRSLSGGRRRNRDR